MAKDETIHEREQSHPKPMVPFAMATQIAAIRQQLMDAILPLLPKEQEYVNWSLPGVNTIKYINNFGHLSLSGETRDLSSPFCLRSLSLENLVEAHANLVAAPWNRKASPKL